MRLITAEDYPSLIASRIAAERLSLSARWLSRLRELLTVDANQVFPSEQLLDHIPSLVDELAGYLAAPADHAIAANAAVMDKARELGLLRHAQHASAPSCCTNTKSSATSSSRFSSKKPSGCRCSRRWRSVSPSSAG